MKIVLPPITNGQDLATINSNFAKIASQMQNNVMYRDNITGEPNQMMQDTDYNSHKLYNVSDILVNGVSILGLNAAANAQAYADAAAVSASLAGTRADSAAASAATATAALALSLLKANNLSDLPSVAAAKTNLALVKSDVGLSAVDNTSDVNKPVSTATGTALNLKAPLISPVFTGTPTVPGYLSITVAASTYAPLANPTFTGTLTAAAGSFTTLSASGNDALFYQNTSGQSIPNTTNTTVTNWTKIADRVNTNFNAATGTFTAPAAGYYSVTGTLTYAAATGVVGTAVQAIILSNAVVVALGTTIIHSTSSIAIQAEVSAIVSLAAGQTVQLQGFQNSGAARVLAAAGTFTTLSINKIT